MCPAPTVLPRGKGSKQGLAETQSTFISNCSDEVLESNGNQERNQNEPNPKKSRSLWRWAKLLQQQLVTSITDDALFSMRTIC